MEKTPFLGAENELQKIYSNLGVMVPVGDLSTGKAPGFKVYEVKYNEDGEDSAVNATIQIYCNSEGSGIYALYKTSDIEELFPNGVPTDYDLDAALNDPMSQDPIQSKTYYAYNVIPFRKDMYTLSMPTNNADHAPAALPYDDYTLIMSIGSSTGGVTTVTSQFSAVAPPNWASADEVLAGNKFIADGVELVGEIATKDSTNLTVNERTVTVPAGYYASNASASVSSDYIIPTGSTSITTNGTDINIAQYATVDVAVPASAVVSGTLPITQNGTGIDVTNYASVNVAVAPTDGGYSIESITYTQHIGGDPQAPSGLNITWTNAPQFAAEEAEELGYKATVLIENTNGSMVPVDYYSCCGTPEYSYGSIIIANECEYSYDAFAMVDPDPENDPVSDKNAKVVIYTNNICSPIWVIPAIYNPTPQI